MKNEVQEVKDKAQKIVDEIDSEKVIAETKLEAARPALEEAEAAATQVYVLVNGVSGRWWPLEPLLADGDTSFGGGVMDGM